MNKGVLTAQQKDFPLALRFFEEARKLAPDSPEIYFNLGLAESKIPGRELRAMAWFGAYLAANPEAHSAAVIREQIEVLDVRNQSATTRLLQLAEEAASKLHEEPDDYTGKWQKLADIAGFYAASGSIDSARKIAALLKGHNDHVVSILVSILRVQGNNGDAAGARKTLAAIRLDDADIYDHTTIASVQRKNGDQAGAMITLNRAAEKAGQMDNSETGRGIVAPWGRRHQMLELVIAAQINAGDPAGAEKTLAEFELNTRSDSRRVTCLANVARGYAKAGNETRARKFLGEAQQLVTTVYSDEFVKNYTYGKSEQCINLTAIAETQGRLGDQAASAATQSLIRKLADSIEDSSRKCWALIILAESQIELTDIAGATETLAAVQIALKTVSDASDTITLTDSRTSLLAKLGVREPMSESAAAARWLEKLNDDDKYGDCALNAATFLDLGAYLKSLPTDNADQLFEGMETAARQMVRAQNTIQEMLREQVKQHPSN